MAQRWALACLLAQGCRCGLALSCRNPKLVGRWCSLAVSALKQVQLQLAPHNANLMMHSTVHDRLLAIAHLAAYAGLGAARAVTSCE